MYKCLFLDRVNIYILIVFVSVTKDNDNTFLEFVY